MLKNNPIVDKDKSTKQNMSIEVKHIVDMYDSFENAKIIERKNIEEQIVPVRVIQNREEIYPIKGFVIIEGNSMKENNDSIANIAAIDTKEIVEETYSIISINKIETPLNQKKNITRKGKQANISSIETIEGEHPDTNTNNN